MIEQETKLRTQLQRAKAIRERYERWAPILQELTTDLGTLLDDQDDGSINDVGVDQLRALQSSTKMLLRRIKEVAVFRESSK